MMIVMKKPCIECGSYSKGGLGYCSTHYQQLKRNGKILTNAEKFVNRSRARGNKSRNKGAHWKIADTTNMKGRHPKSEFINGQTALNKGKHHSNETRDKISRALKGRIAWNKGIITGMIPWNKIGDGIRTTNQLERAKFNKYYQPKVFARDNYTCQICAQYGDYLQADHIESWSEHPELRFELSNCRTLCMACHYYVTFKRKIPEGIIWGHNLSKRIKL